MSQLATRDAAMNAPTGVITVADLLSRYSPATVRSEPEPVTVPVSVASLLQREGRGPAVPAPAVAVPPVVTVYADDEFEDDPRRGPSGTLVKRGAIAAGVLLAAGSAIGLTVVNTASAPSTDTAALGEDTPNRNWLDPQSGPAAAVPSLPGADQLDPGAAPDRSWMDVAFPSSTAGTPDATPGDGADGASSASGGGAEQGPAAPTGGTDDGGAGGGGGPATSGGENDPVSFPLTADEDEEDRGAGSGDAGSGDDGSGDDGSGSGDSGSGDSGSGGSGSGGSGSGGSGSGGSGSGGSGDADGSSGGGGSDDGGDDSPGLVGGVVGGLVDTVAGLL